MKIGIIGCGNMGRAIAKGILSKRILPFNNIYVCDKDSQKTKSLYRKYGIKLAQVDEVIKKCETVIVAVKPQDFKSLAGHISKNMVATEHIISVMAGVSISKIELLLKKKIAVTRAMPNMAALTGKSITCVCHNKHVKNKSFAHKIFNSIGEVIEIEEKKMHAVTAISGSGPAYFFYLAECLKDAAIKLGIRKEKAYELAIVTLVGSGSVLDYLKVTPEALRSKVTSKKGTTEAAIKVLKKKDLKGMMIDAAKAAYKRSKELSEGK